MPRARYLKTLFLPPVLGQYLLWRDHMQPVAEKVDEVIQMGNLVGLSDRMRDASEIRFGPNGATISLIDKFLETFEGWTSLIGPNEVVAMNLPDSWTNPITNKAIRDRWLLSDAPNHFLTATVNKGRLVTHGGLTHGEWISIGRPDSVKEAAALLNEKYDGALHPGPCFAFEGVPNFAANPIFADPLRETLPSWITTRDEIPFSQVHSASGLNTIEGREAFADTYSNLGYVDDVRHANFGSIVTVRDARFFSIVLDIPKDKVLKKIPEPWHLYVEKIPVVDMRDELFD